MIFFEFEGLCIVPEQRSHVMQDQAAQAESSKEEKDNLDSMLLLMVDEPLVIVVKLADRLHNMRTAYALAPNKRRAVATETLEVWCTLAERLGMFAIKVWPNFSLVSRSADL